MKISEKINTKVNWIQEGSTFKYRQLDIEKSEYRAAAKALERLIRKNVIKRVSTGVFYKPKQSAFGELQPQEEELLKPYLFEGEKRIGYITGTSLYNRMGLTTQVPGNIQVASQTKRISTQIGNTRVQPVKSYVDVSNDNFVLLEILDALKDFKIIPNLEKQSALTVLKNKIRDLENGDRERLIEYALSYPPRARALLGALLGHPGESKNLDMLKASLNPLSEYNLGLESILPTASSWNIH